jgi:endonuclease/exonuclease/phosphatase family metal-dependent hydrolase
VQTPFGTAVSVVGTHLMPQLFWPFEVLRVYEVSALLKHLASEGPHMVAGDFNALSAGDGHRLKRAPSWVRAQLLIQAGMTPRWALQRLLDAGYVDCYRARNPGADGFTVPAWDPQARIDYLFASRRLEPALRCAGAGDPVSPRCERPTPRRSFLQLLGRRPTPLLDGEASDHLPVWADFELPGIPI